MVNIQAYLTDNKTGQIVIKFKGAPYLCKIYVEGGQVVYLSYGKHTVDEVISALSSEEVESVNFIDQVRPPKRLDNPAEVTGRVMGTNNTPTVPVYSGQDTVESSMVEETVKDFIDIVGPLGTVMIDKKFKAMGYTRGQDMSAGAYADLLNYIIQEIPEDFRRSFQEKHLL